MAAAFPEILALGEAMIEFNQSQPGRAEFLQGFGGDTSNFCIAASRQGASTGFVSAVGDDPFGRLLGDLWRAEGVDTTFVRIDRTAPTGVYFVT
ncbi:PfkB family carbohydrate kinase, partial [Burkholderia pseudomultivorans]